MPYYVLGDLDGTLNLGGLTDGSFSGLVRDLGGIFGNLGVGPVVSFIFKRLLEDLGVQESYLWLVGNGGMGTIISTITTILPFPTNQR